MTSIVQPSCDLHHSSAFLRHAVEQSLNSCIPTNAAFLAERLHAFNPTEHSSNLLALAYFRQQEYSRAAAALENSTSKENRYLYAVSCIHIDDDQHIRAAEATLRGSTVIPSKHSSKVRSIPCADNVPGGAFGIYYLGLICERTSRKEEAAILYRRALELNPTLWVAFESLAALGRATPANAATFFATAPDDKTAAGLLRAQPFHPLLSSLSTTTNTNTNNETSTKLPTTSATHLRSRTSTLNQQNATPRRRNLFTTPQTPQAPIRKTVPNKQTPSSIPTHQQQTLLKLSHNFSTPSPSVHLRNVAATPSATPAAPRAFRGDPTRWRRSPPRSIHHQHGSSMSVEKSVRRSARLFVSPSGVGNDRNDVVVVEDRNLRRTSGGGRSLVRSGGENVNGENKGENGENGKIKSSGIGRKDGKGKGYVQASFVSKALAMEGRGSVSGTRKSRKRVIDDSGSEGDGRFDVMHLFRILAQAVAALAQFQAAVALSFIASLPSAQKETGFVYSCIGRAYLEMADYKRAEEVFRRATMMDPTRLDGLVDHYSTVLWHLKKEAQLSHLASRVMALDRTSPAAWCVAGNCYALQRDPDTALQCFQKANLLDARRSYTYTLEGHEHFVKEDLDSALASYRQALLIDSRHYNALYGMGVVFHRQEKYDVAEKHFRAALRIHPRNSTLHYHLGLVQAASIKTGKGLHQDIGPALTSFNIAAKLDKKNPIPRFQKARLLQSTGYLREARAELIGLRDTLPKEAAVYFELGRVSEQLEDNSLALEYYTLALDLDPQERQYKKAIEKLEFGRNS